MTAARAAHPFLRLIDIADCLVDKGTHRDQGVFFEQRQSARKGWSCCRHFVSNAIDCLPGAYLSNSPAGLRK